MPQALLNLPGVVTVTGALRVVAVAGATAGAVGPLGNLSGTVDAQNRLVVVFV